MSPTHDPLRRNGDKSSERDQEAGVSDEVAHPGVDSRFLKESCLAYKNGFGEDVCVSIAVPADSEGVRRRGRVEDFRDLKPTERVNDAGLSGVGRANERRSVFYRPQHGHGSVVIGG